MKALRHLALMTVAAGFFSVGVTTATAQVSVSIGEPPVCPYGYYEDTPYNCAPYGYYGPEWFQAVYSSVQGRGFTGRSTSTDTWIITSTIDMATEGQCRRAESMQSNITNTFGGTQCMTRTDVRLPDTDKQNA